MQPAAPPSLGREALETALQREGVHITPPCRNRESYDIRTAPGVLMDASGKHLSLGLQSQTLQGFKK